MRLEKVYMLNSFVSMKLSLLCETFITSLFYKYSVMFAYLMSIETLWVNLNGSLENFYYETIYMYIHYI